MNNRLQTAPESILARNYEKIQKLEEYVSKNMVNRPYHNYSHALDARKAFSEIAEKEGLYSEGVFIGISAMTIHDLITVPYAKDNEERTIEEARKVLPAFGYNSYEVDEILKIIYATKVGVEPCSLLEKIAKDADTENLGRDDFLDKNDAVRSELGLPQNVKWYDGTMKFMQSHKFYTKTAQKLRNEKKIENMNVMNTLIEAALDLVPDNASYIVEAD